MPVRCSTWRHSGGTWRGCGELETPRLSPREPLHGQQYPRVGWGGGEQPQKPLVRVGRERRGGWGCFLGGKSILRVFLTPTTPVGPQQGKVARWGQHWHGMQGGLFVGMSEAASHPD